MNRTDRNELHKIRIAMLNIFLGIAKEAKSKEEIEKYLKLNTKHQAILDHDSEKN